MIATQVASLLDNAMPMCASVPSKPLASPSMRTDVVMFAQSATRSFYPSFISQSTIMPSLARPSARPPLTPLTPRCMARSSKKSKKKPRHARGPDEFAGSTGSTPPSPLVGSASGLSAEEEARDREALRRDVAAFKARNKSDDDDNKFVIVSGTYGLAKKVFDNVLLFDFFLVVGLLGWLLVALIPHFAAKNDVLLDPWLALWQPFTQPVLGVLMLATIGQGMLSYMFSSED